MSSDAPPQPTQQEKAQYEAFRRDLAHSLQKKRTVDRQLAQLEAQIYSLETTYLQETGIHGSGNIIQGFDSYLKTQSSGRRKQDVHENDRIFSESSLTYQRSIDLLGEIDEPANGNEQRVPSQGLTTVVVPPAPPSEQPLSAAQSKRLKDRDYARRKRAASKLSNGTVSDEEPPQALSTSSRRSTKRARMSNTAELE